MRRNVLSQLKFASFGKTLSYTHLLPKNSFKTSLKLGAGLLLASSCALISNSYNTIVKNADKKDDNNLNAFDFEAPELVDFSDAEYKKALENKLDIVVVWNTEENVEASLDEIKVLLYYLKESKKGRGRDLKFFVFKSKNPEDKNQFQEKYDIKVPSNTMFLIKPKYASGFVPVSVQTALYNFERIFDYFQKVRKLKPKNIETFSSSIKHLPSNSILVLAYVPKSSPNCHALRKQFFDLKMEPSLGKTRHNNIDFIIINDSETAKKLNLDVKDEGKLFLASKSSKYNHYKTSVTLKDTNISILPLERKLDVPKNRILEEMSQVCKNYFVFEYPNFYRYSSKYSLVLKVDKNKIEKREYNLCVDTFSKLHHKIRSEQQELFKDLKIIKTSAKLDDAPYKIYLVDNEGREKDFSLYEETQPLTAKERAELTKRKPHSYVYEFPRSSSLSEDNLLKFVTNVKAGKVPETFESQNEPKSQKYSTKIVKDNFKSEILDNNKDHVLFYHSDHCHACKQYGPHYEKFALENLKDPNSNIQYNRMDSDYNRLENLKSFHHTPVFMVLKKDCKLKPFVYLSPYFTPDLLKNFINITVSQKFIDEGVEKQIFKDADAKKKLFDGYKLEEIK